MTPSYSIPVFSRSLGSWRLSVERSAFDQGVLAAHYDKKSEQWQNIVDRYGFVPAYQGLIQGVMCHPHYRQHASSLRVLDAGVGTGAMSAAFREHMDGHLVLDAVDISQAMLQQAQQRLRHPKTTLNLRRANLANLPYADSSFDVVLAAHVIEHLPDPKVALAELYRVLKPGGILIGSITRTSLFGALVQMLWRTHRVSSSVALNWLNACGLQATRIIPYRTDSPASRLSLGCVGRKPSFT